MLRPAPAPRPPDIRSTNSGETLSSWAAALFLDPVTSTGSPIAARLSGTMPQLPLYLRPCHEPYSPDSGYVL
jgi:hypothetical protein